MKILLILILLGFNCIAGAVVYLMITIDKTVIEAVIVYLLAIPIITGGSVKMSAAYLNQFFAK